MNDSKLLGCQVVGSVFIFAVSVIVMIGEKGYWIETLSVVVFIICLLYALYYYRQCKNLIQENKKERQSSINERIRFHNQIKDKDIEINKISEELIRQTRMSDKLLAAIHSDDVFKTVSSLMADMEAIVFSEAEHELKIKKRPAIKAADVVKQLREKSREHTAAYKEMKYRYEFLLKSFPELSKYVDDYDALKRIAECSVYAELEEGVDRVSAFISKDEWNNLPVDERNQLALDKYKEKGKSNWTIGVEYEMYVDYLLRCNGFSTIHYGILKGLNDLGRDIIAKKDKHYYVIQCKNWSRKKEIHENVICQLFGTTLEYKIEKSKKMPDRDWDKRITPVLYSTTKLSDTAMKFADKLGVVVIIKEMGEYPMIKCNIGKSGEKIYHLPFDQQYYNTMIVNDGEFYAWTVKEAVEAGFRRAFKFSGYGTNI